MEHHVRSESEGDKFQSRFTVLRSPNSAIVMYLYQGRTSVVPAAMGRLRGFWPPWRVRASARTWTHQTHWAF